MNVSEYLQNIADQFPARDAQGYVAGFYVYAGPGAKKREAGPFPTREEAQGWAEKILDGTVVVGHVFTAKGKIVHDPKDLAPMTVEEALRALREIENRCQEVRLKVVTRSDVESHAETTLTDEQWQAVTGTYAWRKGWGEFFDSERAEIGEMLEDAGIEVAG